MQVTRVHAGKRSNTQVCSPASYGIPMGLITATIVYLLAIPIIMRFTSQFAISIKAMPQWVQLLG